MSEDKIRFLEEGETCECGGTAVLETPENCSCHISPPCRACEENKFKCNACGSTEVEVKP